MTQQANINIVNGLISIIETNFSLIVQKIKSKVSTVNGVSPDNSGNVNLTLSDVKTVNTLATSGTISLTDNSINKITPTAAVTFTLPTVTDATTFHQILVQVNLSTVYTITVGTSYYFDNTAPDLSTAGVYNLIFEYDNTNGYWVVGCVSKGAAS